MSSSPLRRIVNPASLIVLSITWGLMVAGATALMPPSVGTQEPKSGTDHSTKNSSVIVLTVASQAVRPGARTKAAASQTW